MQVASTVGLGTPLGLRFPCAATSVWAREGSVASNPLYPYNKIFCVTWK